MKIIYADGGGGMAYVEPSGQLPVEATALLMVPPGIPFSIVPDDVLPDDYTFRDAWEVDIPFPDGHGADYGIGSDYGVALRDRLGNARLTINAVGVPRAISTAEARESVAGITCAGGAEITINLEKARAIAHDIRRQQRAAEFAPLDEAIARKIPGTDLAGIEAMRDLVRVKYADMQEQIDAAASPGELREVLKQTGKK